MTKYTKKLKRQSKLEHAIDTSVDYVHFAYMEYDEVQLSDT